MGNLTMASMFIIFANVIMLFSATAMTNINPTGTSCYNIKGSILEGQILGTGEEMVLTSDPKGDLPGSDDSGLSLTNNPFTDIFNSILSWVKSLPGIRHALNIISAPMNILSCTGLPNNFIVPIGALWYMITLLILVAWIYGRDQ